MKTVVNKQAKPYSQIKNSWITDTNISDTWYRLLCYIEMQSENWVFYKEEMSAVTSLCVKVLCHTLAK